MSDQAYYGGLIAYDAEQTISFTTMLSGSVATGVSWGKATVEVDVDGGGFSSASNAPSEIGTTGVHTLQMDASETQGKRVTVRIPAASGSHDAIHIHMYTIDAESGNNQFLDWISQIPSSTDAAAAVWNRALSLHTSVSQFGGFFRQFADSAGGRIYVIQSSSTSSVIRTTATQASGYFDGMYLVVKQGVGFNQPGVARRVSSYSSTNGAFTLESALPFTPSTGHYCYLVSNPHGIDLEEIREDTGTTLPATLSTIDGIVDSILVDTGTTLPSTLTTIEGKVDTIDGIVDAILVDTGTTLPSTLSTIDGIVDAILVDTGTTLPVTLSGIEGKIDTIDGIVDEILVDTGSSIPTTLSGLATSSALATVDTNVDSILVDTGTTLPGLLNTIDVNVDAILVDTGTTLPGTLSTIEGKVDTIDGIVDAILVDTGTTIPGLISGLNDLSAAQVNAEVDTALTDIGLDHLLSAAVTGTDITDDSVIAQLVSKSATADWDTFDNITNSLEAIADNAGGSAPTAADIADAVLSEAVADHSGTVGSLAEFIDAILTDTGTTIPGSIAALNDLSSADVQNSLTVQGYTAARSLLLDNLDAAVSTRSTQSSVDTIDGIVDAILVDTDTTIPGLIAALNDLSAAEVNAEVDTALSDIGLDHLLSASVTGTDIADDSIVAQLSSKSATADWDTFDNTTDSLEAIADNAGGGGGGPSAADIAAAVWDKATVDHTDPGSFGLAVGTTIPSNLTTIDGIVDDILVDTGTSLPATLATIDGIVDSILVDTGTTLPGTLTTIEGKVDTIDGIVDAILVDTGTTLPGTLASIGGKVDTVDTAVDAILVDTGTTLPGTLTTIEGKVDTIDGIVDAILIDTGTTLDGKLDTIDGIVDAILVDTGTTLPATLATLATQTSVDTIDGIVDAILVDTDTTIPGLIAALNDFDPATDAVFLSTVGVEAVSDQVWTEILADHSGTVGSTAEALAALTSAPSAADIADAVLDEDLSLHNIVGSLGKAIADIETDATAILEDTGTTLPATLSGLATASALATVDSIVDDILVDTGTTLPGTLATLATASALSTVDGIVDAILVDTGTTLPATLSTIEGKVDTIDGIVDSILVDTDTTIPALIAALNDPSAADISSAVWDDILSDHTDPGSAGEALGAVAAPPSAATIASAVLDKDLSLHTTAGSLGKAIADIETDVTAILVDTGTTLPGTLATLATSAEIAALNDLSSADIQLAMDAQGYTTARAAKLDNLDAAVSSVSSALAALNDLSSADVQSALTAQGYTTVRSALLDNLDAAISTVVTNVAALNDLSSADVQSALTSQGLTTTRAGYLDNLTTILTSVERNRKIHGNRVVISPDDLTVTVYEDDDTTVAFTFTISADGRTRTPD